MQRRGVLFGVTGTLADHDDFASDGAKTAGGSISREGAVDDDDTLGTNRTWPPLGRPSHLPFETPISIGLDRRSLAMSLGAAVSAPAHLTAAV
jgi:hypothetical protein